MFSKLFRAFFATLCALLILQTSVTAQEDGENLTGDADDQSTASGDTSDSGLGSTSSANMHLEQYQLVQGPIELNSNSYFWTSIYAEYPEWPGVKNISGMCYNRTRNSLFLVMNDPPFVLEYDLHKSAVQRYIYMEDFDDLEDLVWLNNNRFALVEERRQNLVLVNLPTSGNVGNNLGQTVKYNTAIKYNIDPVDAGNVGLEGVAYDAAKKQFFAIKEKTPSKIYKISEPTFGTPKVSIPFDLEANNYGCTDFSGVYFESKTQHLLLLSDEGKAVIEVTQDGTEVSRLSLSGLAQPEGICIGSDGTLYIASEPSQLYFYRKP